LITSHKKDNEIMKKITVVGAGNVGTTTAQLIAERGLADVLLIDVLEGIPQGKALDIFEACPLWHSNANVTGTNDYADTAGSDIAVITAGLARKPGMSRDDLLHANAKIIKAVARSIAEASPDCIIIVVTNPMDAMAQVAREVTGFPHSRVIGMGGVLDTARMRSFISIRTGAHPKDIHAMVLGGHGDLMVPMTSLTTVRGKNISEVIEESEMEQIIERTKNGGAEIVGLLKSGSAYYAPAASTVEMIESIFGIKSATLPCSVYLNGQYGIEGVYTGVPVTLGPEGLKEIIELDLTDNELVALRRSAEAIRGLMKKLNV
jgi:malate dehydrogenase